MSLISGLGVASATGTTNSLRTVPTLLQKGRAYYQGKTLTLDCPSSAGGDVDEECRDMAPYVASYLHATMNVVDIVGGDGVAGEDAAAASGRNGLTVGYMNIFLGADAVLTHTPGLNFSPDRVDFIEGSSPSNYTVVVPPGSVYGNFKSLITASTSSHPARWMISSPTGFNAADLRLIAQAFDIPSQLVPGYSNFAAVEAGFLRGDAPLFLGPDPNVGPLVESGKAVAILNITPLSKESPYYNVLSRAPTLQQMINKDTPKKPTRSEKTAIAGLEAMIPIGSFFFFSPTNTPAAEVAALRAAFEYAQKVPTVDTELNSIGQAYNYLPGPDGKTVYDDALKVGKKIISDLG